MHRRGTKFVRWNSVETQVCQRETTSASKRCKAQYAPRHFESQRISPTVSRVCVHRHIHRSAVVPQAPSTSCTASSTQLSHLRSGGGKGLCHGKNKMRTVHTCCAKMATVMDREMCPPPPPCALCSIVLLTGGRPADPLSQNLPPHSVSNSPTQPVHNKRSVSTKWPSPAVRDDPLCGWTI